MLDPRAPSHLPCCGRHHTSPRPADGARAPPDAGSLRNSIRGAVMTTLEGLTIGKGRRTDSVTFLPEPDPRPRRYTIVSVDDHLVEPPDTFAGRLPQRFVEKGPKVVEQSDGSQVWLMEDRIIPNAGTNAVSG